MEKAYRRDFEAARSFDLEDDELFCPFHLLTEDDVRFLASLYLARLCSLSSYMDIAFANFIVRYTNIRRKLHSIHSASSDRSSLSSGSPEQSPLQQQLQPTSQFLLPPSTGSFTPQAFQQPTAAASQPPKILQPVAQRTRNAIPIVDPTTRNVASPPPSVSPARQMQFMNSRRW